MKREKNELMKKIELYGDSFSLYTVIGIVVHKSEEENTVCNGEECTLRSVNFTILSIKYEDKQVDNIVIDKKFYCAAGDVVAVTYIQNKESTRMDISIVNLNNGISVAINNASDIVKFYEKKEASRKYLLEIVFSFIVFLFFFNQAHLSCAKGFSNEVICSYIVTVSLFIFMFLFTKLDFSDKRTKYSVYIKETVDDVTDLVKCPVLFKTNNGKGYGVCARIASPC